ncbi:MAG: hypothetical protein ABC559_02050 [Candidatus Methanosuratincola petrocarbonis]
MDLDEGRRVEHLKIEEKRIEVVWRDRGPPTLPPTPDTVWKEIYEIKDGKLVLVKRVEGRHFPAHFVGEQIIFDEEASDERIQSREGKAHGGERSR